MAEIGSAFVSILPSVRGLGAAIQKQAGPQIDRAGVDAGKRYGDKMGSHLKGAGRAIFAPLAAAAAAVGVGNFLKESLAEARESQKVGAITAQVIKTTGGAAKVSAAQVGTLAAAISTKTGVDDEAVQTGANLLLTFKNVRNEVGAGSNVFDRATAAAVDLSAAGFGSVDSASKSLGKALNDPVKGITALGRSGVTFTAQQKEQIKTLVESGRTLDAQKIILGELESQVGGTAAASATFGEKASVAFGNVKEQIGTALLPVLDRLGAVFVNTIAPAISGFITGMQEGSGAGGRLVTALGTVVGVLTSTAQFINSNRTAFAALAAVIGLVAAATAAHSLALAINSGALSAWFVQTRVVQAATKAWAAVQWVLNAALSANPIGLVVVALVALAAGLVIAYKRSETFRNIVNGAWAAIKAGVAAAWGGIKVVFNALRTFFTVTIPAAAAAFTAKVSGAWDAVKSALSATWNRGIKPVFTAVKNFITVTIPAAFRSGLGVAAAVWDRYKTGLANVWNRGIKPVFAAVKNFITVTIPAAFESGRVAIGTKWSAVRDRIKNVWDKSLKPVFDRVNTMITETVPKAFDKGVAAIKTAWDKVKGYAARPINFVIDTVLNHGLLAAFNSVAGSVLGKKAPHINSLPLVKFAEGSEDHRAQIARPNQLRVWAEPETGGEAYIPLAQRKRARSTQILSKVASHFGYGLTQFANGGTLVKAGRHLKQLGYSVAEGPPPFGPVHRVHTAGSAHYRGLALDINHGAGTSRAEQAALDRIVPYLKGLGLRVIWRSAGHFNHLHTEATGKGSILGRLAGGAGDLLSSLDPRKLIGKGLDKLGGIPGAGSTLAKIAGGVPRKLLGMLVDKAKSVIASVNPFSDTSDPSGGGAGGANRWAGVARRVLDELGRPGSELGPLLRRIQFESGGNPNAINLTDSNARAGHPSRGLMQTIPGTFNAFAGKYRSRGITDPLANIYAGSRYAINRYGSIRAIDPRVRPRGYDRGGILPPGGVGANYGRAPERVLTPSNTASFDRLVRMLETGGVGGGGVQFNAPVYTQTPEEFARRLVADQRLHEALHPTF